MTDHDEWSGRAVFVLSIAIGIAFVIGVLAIAVSPMPFGGDSARALSTGFGALLGIVAGYVLGAHLRRRRD